MPDEPLPPISAQPTEQSVEDIEIVLFDPGPLEKAREGGQPQGAQYSVQVLMSDGNMDVRQGNLIPHLTKAEVDQLVAIVTRLRGKAEDAWIP